VVRPVRPSRRGPSQPCEQARPTCWTAWARTDSHASNLRRLAGAGSLTEATSYLAEISGSRELSRIRASSLAPALSLGSLPGDNASLTVSDDFWRETDAQFSKDTRRRMRNVAGQSR
jgi:hypothetical protein